MPTPTRTYTRTHNATIFADPYKKCGQCGGWVDGALDAPGPLIVLPCEHQPRGRGIEPYIDVCPSWGPVDGCACPAGWHEMRPADPSDGKVY